MNTTKTVITAANYQEAMEKLAQLKYEQGEVKGARFAAKHVAPKAGWLTGFGVSTAKVAVKMTKSIVNEVMPADEDNLDNIEIVITK